ncbi:unnamed protein product [marine sediment metagenome]|uniref:Uncharacterized protein n=1 Tax=marine sediment metagenome TaxID=412755 RepID=X1BH38_9ZZZZ
MTHEILHSISGEYYYKKGVSKELEEGTVEYITEGSKYFGYRGRGKKYSMGYSSYQKEVKSVAMLMEIVGRKEYLRMWKKGFKTEYKTLAKKVRAKGYSRTASVIENWYSHSADKEHIHEYVRKDVKEGKKPVTVGIFSYETDLDFKEKQILVKKHEKKLMEVY